MSFYNYLNHIIPWKTIKQLSQTSFPQVKVFLFSSLLSESIFLKSQRFYKWQASSYLSKTPLLAPPKTAVILKNTISWDPNRRNSSDITCPQETTVLLNPTVNGFRDLDFKIEATSWKTNWAGFGQHIHRVHFNLICSSGASFPPASGWSRLGRGVWSRGVWGLSAFLHPQGPRPSQLLWGAWSEHFPREPLWWQQFYFPMCKIIQNCLWRMCCTWKSYLYSPKQGEKWVNINITIIPAGSLGYFCIAL